MRSKSEDVSRREFLATGTAAACAAGLVQTKNGFAALTQGANGERPNIILAMADDLGWGGLAYQNANDDPPITPHLDKMASEAVRFDQFYSAGAVCSPTRASVLTGRNPARMGLWTGGCGGLRTEELVLPEILAQNGYMTGHFGKWHLGNRNGLTPEDRGYHETFWTGNNVGHVNPDRYVRNGEKIGVVEGDDSLILADEVLKFIDKAVTADKPFFITLWFHAPHSPWGSSQEFMDLYPHLKENSNGRKQYSDISALDKAMGNLRQGLKDKQLSSNTMLWFTSDNGGVGEEELRGGKGTIYEGGFRVGAILEWPDKAPEPFQSPVAGVTSDFFPTILDYCGLSDKALVQPLDGVSLRSAIDKTWERRPEPIGFQWSLWDCGYDPDKSTYAIVDQDERLVISPEMGVEYFDLATDPGEKNNLAEQHPDRVGELRASLEQWITSFENSYAGDDYGDVRTSNAGRGKMQVRAATSAYLGNRRLQILSNPPFQGTLAAEILSLDGTLLWRGSTRAVGHARAVSFRVPEMAPGSYIVQLHDARGEHHCLSVSRL